MKTRTSHLSSVVAFLLFTSASAQIPNGGFESWVDEGTYMDPAGWLTYNDIYTDSGPVITVEQGFPGAVGAYCAVITTQAYQDLTGAVQGWLSINGFTYAGRPALLTGQWQYAIQPSDTGVVSVALSKWNSVLNTRAPIAFGEMKVTGDLMGWHPLSVPLTYYSEEVPDSAYIQFVSSINFGDPVVGSFIKVDDLAFAGTMGVQDQSAVTDLRIFPSPATNILNVVAGQRIHEVKVLDITGRCVMQRKAAAEAITLDVAPLRGGRYLVRSRMADGRNIVRPFVKQ